MLKKIATSSIAGIILGLAIMINAGIAQELPMTKSNNPSATPEELQNEIARLRTELAQVKETAAKAQELALKTRIEAAKFKEEVLAKLGVWRGKVAEAVMMAMEAKEIAAKAGISEELQKKIDDLEADVSSAKEMAATAKIRADQSAKEAAEARMKTELLLTTVNELVGRVKTLEEKLAAGPAPKLIPKNLYRVKKGDNLWRISGYRNIYNDPSQWRKIYEANKDKIEDPNLIYPGQRLLIPPKRSHRVLKGENLWSISNYESIYNDPSQWRKIYEANKDKIEDPNLIYPGQRLLIPQD